MKAMLDKNLALLSFLFGLFEKDQNNLIYLINVTFPL